MTLEHPRCLSGGRKRLNAARSGSNIRIQTARPPLMTPAQTAVTATTPRSSLHDLHADFD